MNVETVLTVAAAAADFAVAVADAAADDGDGAVILADREYSSLASCHHWNPACGLAAVVAAAVRMGMKWIPASSSSMRTVIVTDVVNVAA